MWSAELRRCPVMQRSKSERDQTHTLATCGQHSRNVDRSLAQLGSRSGLTYYDWTGMNWTMESRKWYWSLGWQEWRYRRENTPWDTAASYRARDTARQSNPKLIYSAAVCAIRSYSTCDLRLITRLFCPSPRLVSHPSLTSVARCFPRIHPFVYFCYFSLATITNISTKSALHSGQTGALASGFSASPSTS